MKLAYLEEQANFFVNSWKYVLVGSDPPPGVRLSDSYRTEEDEGYNNIKVTAEGLKKAGFSVFGSKEALKDALLWALSNPQPDIGQLKALLAKLQ